MVKDIHYKPGKVYNIFMEFKYEDSPTRRVYKQPDEVCTKAALLYPQLQAIIHVIYLIN